jgi:D-serine deaminase-like pyridoxal phosphate-dependent protein
MEWEDHRRALDGRRLPAALIDLDALDRNVDRVRARVEPCGKTVRVASKSVRHRGLLERILARGGAAFRGILSYSGEEAAWLASHGFDDILIAYPTLQTAALDAVAAAVAGGQTIRCIADATEHLEAIGAAGRRASVVIDVVIDLDVSYRPLGGRAHVGVRRSPLRSSSDVAALARAARAIPSVRVVGLMAYEAHVAGVPDTAASLAKTAAVRAMKALAVPGVLDLRRRSVEALRSEGVDLQLVNGGGTGSMDATARDPSVTEVAVGSGFLCSHLFDGYLGLDLEPAQFFALEVVRLPDGEHATCAGGGYVASGSPGPDRLPIPWRPRGLEWLLMEGAGEVQSPLRVTGCRDRVRIGDPVIFRHAKAGELAERFSEYLLVRGGAVASSEPTYRGEGRTFL